MPPFNAEGTYTPPPGSEQPNPPANASLSAFRTWQNDLSAALSQTLKANGSTDIVGPMLFDEGTAGAPSIAFAADTDTGLFHPAPDQIGFAVDGGEQLRLSHYYFRLSSSSLQFAAVETIPSAATTDLTTFGGNYVQVSGTTTITSFGDGVEGLLKFAVFSGILTLTNNANVILPTGANITTAAGDVAVLFSQGSGVWRCVAYWRKDGTALATGTVNNSNWSGTDLAIVNGGTGASDAAGARTNLGLGTLAEMDLLDDLVYTGSDANLANYPVGTVLLVDDAANTHPARNSVVIVTQLSTYAFDIGGAGTTLTGTWRARGGIPTGGASSLLVQRMA